MLLENIYSTDVTHDDDNVFIVQTIAAIKCFF